MVDANFAPALEAVLRQEGGYVDHPLDPGGATNRGITQATLAAFRGRPVAKADVMALTRDEAAQIYKNNYWRAIRADELPPGIDLALFDLAVNSGPKRAIRLLQSILSIAEDGLIGPVTLRAAKDANTAELIKRLSAARLSFLRRLSGWAVFGRGWSKRVAAIESAALLLASESPLSNRYPSTSNGKDNSMLNDTKSMLASRTVWSNLIGLGALGLSLIGIDVGSVDQNAFVSAILSVVTGASFIASTMFRVLAVQQLR
jgi:lysozyme family protein